LLLMKFQPVRLPASLPCASPLLTAPVLLPFLLVADGSPDAPGLAHQAGQRLRWVFSPIRKPVLLMLALGVLLLHVWQGWPWRLLMQSGYAASSPVSLLAETKPCFELLFRLPGKVRQELVVAGSCSWPAAEAAAISPQELWPIHICRLCTVVHQQVRCLQRLLPACRYNTHCQASAAGHWHSSHTFITHRLAAGSCAAEAERGSACWPAAGAPI
jgi:hypothetical protein